MDKKILALAQYLDADPDDVNETRWDSYEYGKEEYKVYDDHDDAYEDAKESLKNLFDDLGLDTFSDKHVIEDILTDCVYDSWTELIKEVAAEDAEGYFSYEDDTYGNELVKRLSDNNCIKPEDGGFVAMAFVADDIVYSCKNGTDFTDDIDKADRFICEDDVSLLDKKLSNVADKLTKQFDEPITFFSNFEETLLDKDYLVECYVEMMFDQYDNLYDWVDEQCGGVSGNQEWLQNYIDWDAVADYCIELDGLAHTLATYDGKENMEKFDGDWYYIYRLN